MGPPPLETYIELGCLVREISPLEPAQYSPGWSEVRPDHPDAARYRGFRPCFNAALALSQNYALRIFRCTCGYAPAWEIWRVYLHPEDVACSTMHHNGPHSRTLLEVLLPDVNISPRVWTGDCVEHKGPLFDVFATGEDSSLFYIFNTLPSPKPDLNAFRSAHHKGLAERLLEDDDLPWQLKTNLYPYQRRAAVAMLQKELAPSMKLDPRLEPRRTPTGRTFFYAPRDLAFRATPRYYDTVQGGILAETMGLGKTLICIAVVLATRGQLPQIPLQYDTKVPKHSRVPSLLDLAARKVASSSIAYKSFFDDFYDATGDHLESCRLAMESHNLYYSIPPRVIRSSRRSDILGPSETVRLVSGTIIVVPANIVQQWESELRKHVNSERALNVLVMNGPRSVLPSSDRLSQYDIVLFSRTRFEKENNNPDANYVSPLKSLHWLRIIIDEGHGFSSGSTNAAIVAEKLVRAERRWIVSGTPARDLLGIEVDLPALAIANEDLLFREYKEESLEKRRTFNFEQERTSGAVTSIGALATRFLKAQPWSQANVELANESASWDDLIYRHEHPRKRLYSRFSVSLRSTLQSLVVKTRSEDVDMDMRLPPLIPSVVRLQPSCFDKMSANLFVLLYTTNAVTSERKDVDYLFHSNSRTHLYRLTANLRQSAFFWVGFTEDMVLASIETAEKYLSKHEATCTPEDRRILEQTMDTARLVLASPVWRALTQTQEMGLSAVDWPHKMQAAWCFDDCLAPPVIGLTQSLQAQEYVNNQLASDDPLRGLEELGLESKMDVREEIEATKTNDSSKMAINGVPSSSLEHGMGLKRINRTGVSKVAPTTRKGKASKGEQDSSSPHKDASEQSKSSTPKKAKRKLSFGSSAIDLAPDSPLGSTRITGTTSAKFSYLIDRISELQQEEKILIFFDGPHIAYYLSQALDLLNIKHLIYASALPTDIRSKYVVLFDTDESQRVMLMDIKLAAHGLNVSAASRVFFINPPCRPDVEAQAVKRAHRIGQTRTVYVETLILQDTVEEKMHDRAASMTKREHLAAKMLEEDESIRHIIQNAKVIPITEDEISGFGQMAPLKRPQQLFGRPGRAPKAEAHKLETQIFEGKGQRSGKSRKTDALDTAPTDDTRRAVSPPVNTCFVVIGNGSAPTGASASSVDHGTTNSIFGGV